MLKPKTGNLMNLDIHFYSASLKTLKICSFNVEFHSIVQKLINTLETAQGSTCYSILLNPRTSTIPRWPMQVVTTSVTSGFEAKFATVNDTLG
jgi:hypothetical protein